VTKTAAVDVQKAPVEHTAKQHTQEPSITKSNSVSENAAIAANINRAFEHGIGL
jgi:hypothetical protein